MFDRTEGSDFVRFTAHLVDFACVKLLGIDHLSGVFLDDDRVSFRAFEPFSVKFERFRFALRHCGSFEPRRPTNGRMPSRPRDRASGSRLGCLPPVNLTMRSLAAFATASIARTPAAGFRWPQFGTGLY